MTNVCVAYGAGKEIETSQLKICQAILDRAIHSCTFFHSIKLMPILLTATSGIFSKIVWYLLHNSHHFNVTQQSHKNVSIVKIETEQNRGFIIYVGWHNTNSNGKVRTQNNPMNQFSHQKPEYDWDGFGWVPKVSNLRQGSFRKELHKWGAPIEWLSSNHSSNLICPSIKRS